MFEKKKKRILGYWKRQPLSFEEADALEPSMRLIDYAAATADDD